MHWDDKTVDYSLPEAASPGLKWAAKVAKILASMQLLKESLQLRCENEERFWSGLNSLAACRLVSEAHDRAGQVLEEIQEVIWSDMETAIQAAGAPSLQLAS